MSTFPRNLHWHNRFVNIHWILPATIRLARSRKEEEQQKEMEMGSGILKMKGKKRRVYI